MKELIYKQILENTQDVVIITKAEDINSPGPEIVYVNKAFTELTGYTREEAIGGNPRILQNEETDAVTKKKIRDALEKRESVRVTIKNFSKSGRPYWLDLTIIPLEDEAGVVTHFAAIERDVTNQVERELLFQEQSINDVLAGILNRRGFDQVVDKFVARLDREKEIFSLLMFDLDNFKNVNDTYGHKCGDETIRLVAESCKRLSRMNDEVARFGGDEFCMILANIDIEEAIVIAERVRVAISKIEIPIDDAGSTTSITSSIGVAEIRSSEGHESDFIRQADMALYEAKNRGRNCVVSFYDLDHGEHEGHP